MLQTTLYCNWQEKVSFCKDSPNPQKLIRTESRLVFLGTQAVGQHSLLRKEALI